MDAKILEFILSPVLTVLVFSIFVIVFKNKISAIEVDPSRRKIRAEFVQRVEQIGKRAKGVKEKTAGSPSMPTAEQVIDYGNLTARDIVIEAWGALKQMVYDAGMASGIALTPATGIPTAVQRLTDAKVIDVDIASMARGLHEIGQNLAGAKGLLPPEEYAWAYKENTYLIVDLLMLSLLPPRKAEEVVPSPATEGRLTTVGELFSEPRAGNPAAILHGVGGSVRGRKFPVDKAHYRIGSSSNNDLCIQDDNYVSGSHAYLGYEKGSLFLFDRDSRNGTFLNDKRVTGSGVAVRNSDTIRIGEALFEVTDVPAPK